MPSFAGTCAAGNWIDGTYGLLVSGNSLQANATGGKYLSGALTFSGATCTVSGANITGGNNGAWTTQSVAGTYSLNSDNTVTIYLNPADQSPTQTYIVGVGQSNWEAVGIEMDGSAAATIDLTPQVQIHQPGSGYTNRSLIGQFAIVCNGLSSNKDDLNYVRFDGKGNLSGQNPYNYDGAIGDSPYSGVYTVNSDGSISGTLANDYSEYTFNGAIDAKGFDVKYIYNRADVGEIVACHGRK